MYSMIDEVKELKEIYLKRAEEREKNEDERGALFLKSYVQEIEELLTLFNEMKMAWSDWARLKEFAVIRREYKLCGY